MNERPRGQRVGPHAVRRAARAAGRRQSSHGREQDLERRSRWTAGFVRAPPRAEHQTVELGIDAREGEIGKSRRRQSVTRRRGRVNGTRKVGVQPLEADVGNRGPKCGLVREVRVRCGMAYADASGQLAHR